MDLLEDHRAAGSPLAARLLEADRATLLAAFLVVRPLGAVPAAPAAEEAQPNRNRAVA